jgi:hypothetical protein
MVGISAGWLGDKTKAAHYIKDICNWQLGFVVSWHKGDKFWFQLIHIQKNYETIFNNNFYTL